MEGKVTFSKSGKGYSCGRVVIPKCYLEDLGISEDNREIEIVLVDNQIIITSTN